MRKILLAVAAAACATVPASAQLRSGNPIIPGWYADPEVHIFANQYWIFPTYSAPYNQQVFMDAFSSTDLVTWVKHPHVLDTANVSWAHRAVWAPSVVEKDGWYYIFFGANDIQNDQQKGGIGVARARSPEGPFKDYLGKPLIDAFHNGAQPIDQMVFQDRDGWWYIVYGGWQHCNIAKLNNDFTALVPFPDGTTFKEITPKGYVEGAYMLQKDGKYYFMWSEGGWTGPDYAVAYAIGTSPFGPFERVGKILQQDSTVATGAGHHSILHAPSSNNWYIVYHRRPLGETDRNHRAVSIDELHFDANGKILPVRITKEGVAADHLVMPAQIPGWAQGRWQTFAAQHALRLSSKVSSQSLEGDFDGDGKHDIALLVESTRTHKTGIVIVHQNSAAPFLVGAGVTLGNAGDDFEWMDSWSIKHHSPTVKSDALLLSRESSASGLVQFVAGRYRWKQQGD